MAYAGQAANIAQAQQAAYLRAAETLQFEAAAAYTKAQKYLSGGGLDGMKPTGPAVTAGNEFNSN